MFSSPSSQTTLRAQPFRPFEGPTAGSEHAARVKHPTVSEAVYSLVSRALGLDSRR